MNLLTLPKLVEIMYIHNEFIKTVFLACAILNMDFIIKTLYYLNSTYSIW